MGLDAAGPLGIQQQAADAAAVAQQGLFRDVEPQWVEVVLNQITSSVDAPSKRLNNLRAGARAGHGSLNGYWRAQNCAQSSSRIWKIP